MENSTPSDQNSQKSRNFSSALEENLSQTKEETTEIKKEPEVAEVEKRLSLQEWLSAMHWKTNPFSFTITPSLFVGHKRHTNRILLAIEEHHKFIMLTGPTGSGKTTLLKWLQYQLNGFDTIYIGKAPRNVNEFVSIFRQKYSKPWYAFWEKDITSIYQLPDFLNKKLRGKRLVVFLDEAHEADVEILEWLRVLGDQIENMTIVFSGLSNFENTLRDSLETLAKRMTEKIELLSLTKEETEELIIKRIQNVGGTGKEFLHMIDEIYDYTGGFPREIIRVCNDIVNSAIISGKTQLEFSAKEREAEQEQPAPSRQLLDRMTPMQKEILEQLSRQPCTPGQIANSINLEKYKSRQHAVRSINNIMKALHEEGYLERRKEDKAYVYSLSPRISTLFVKR